jgi:hypothetical protein
MKAKLVKEGFQGDDESGKGDGLSGFRGGYNNSKSYSESEVIDMLKDVYCRAAEMFNDYGKRYSDYEEEAREYIKKYMMTHKKYRNNEIETGYE